MLPPPLVGRVSQLLRNRSRRYLKLLAAAFGLLLALCWNDQIAYAGDKEFSPITTNLLGYSTTRDVVDIEIMGSTSVVPHEHLLQPDRILSLRLERAYITDFHTKAAPGFSLLTISVDQPTGLPEALISAVSLQGRFHQDIAGVPTLSLDEAIRRHVILNVRSDHSEASRAGYLKGAAECVGNSAGNDLFEMTLSESLGARACSHSVFPDGRKWLVRSDGVPSSIIECHGDGKRIVGCSTDFAFQKFFVQIQFHQSLLADWHSLITFGEAFLASKQMN